MVLPWIIAWRESPFFAAQTFLSWRSHVDWNTPLEKFPHELQITTSTKLQIARNIVINKDEFCIIDSAVERWFYDVSNFFGFTFEMKFERWWRAWPNPWQFNIPNSNPAVKFEWSEWIVGRINAITQVLPRGGNLEGLWSEPNLGGDTNPHGGYSICPGTKYQHILQSEGSICKGTT